MTGGYARALRDAAREVNGSYLDVWPLVTAYDLDGFYAMRAVAVCFEPFVACLACGSARLHSNLTLKLH